MEVTLNKEPSHFKLELEDGQENYSPSRTHYGFFGGIYKPLRFLVMYTVTVYNGRSNYN